ncbi:MAG TPA: hypothetical protein VFX61_10990 [Micromonosporaceae bacterium]|nr:hypothetical protein [Micromonosporaceae bacterium]
MPNSPAADVAASRTRRAGRLVGVLAVAFFVGFQLPLLQLRLARYAEVVDFDGPFEAGNERVVTVAPTVLLWFCALAAPLAVGLAAVVFKAGLLSRLLGAAAATVGVLTSGPAMVENVSPEVHAQSADAVRIGLAFGLVVAVLVALLPVLSAGVAVHAFVLWALALLLPDAQMFAGVVSVRWPPRGALYLFAAMLLVSGLLAYWVARRGRPAVVGLLCGAVGPVLAALVYPISPYDHILWDKSAADIATTVAVCGLVAAGIAAGSAASFRYRERAG